MGNTMKVPGLLAKKGGSGKTTVAVHLAACGAQAGSRVLLMDLDPQRSSADWWRAREADTPPQLVKTEPDNLSAARAVEASVAADARTAPKAFGVSVAGLTSAQRAAYSPALVAGLVATAAEPNGKAAAEMRMCRHIEREPSK